MKKLSVVLFVILFLAVAALFILQFTGKGKGNISGTSEGATSLTTQDIAYVNIDTIIFKFDMFFDRREDLVGKQQKAEAELNSKGSAYERGARDYQ